MNSARRPLGRLRLRIVPQKFSATLRTTLRRAGRPSSALGPLSPGVQRVTDERPLDLAGYELRGAAARDLRAWLSAQASEGRELRARRYRQGPLGAEPGVIVIHESREQGRVWLYGPQANGPQANGSQAAPVTLRGAGMSLTVASQAGLQQVGYVPDPQDWTPEGGHLCGVCSLPAQGRPSRAWAVILTGLTGVNLALAWILWQQTS